jgi:menaquinone-dependent protoporphyrinogen IX oxidase
MTKALIVYGTRYGATASTSEEIAGGLRQEGFDVRVVNAKKDKVKDINERACHSRQRHPNKQMD